MQSCKYEQYRIDVPCGINDCEYCKQQEIEIMTDNEYKGILHDLEVVGFNPVYTIDMPISNSVLNMPISSELDNFGSFISVSAMQDWVWHSMTEKGFHDGKLDYNRYKTMARLALIHTEVSEAVQEVKRHWDEDNDYDAPPNNLNKFGEELADTAIRLFDLAGVTGVNLEQEIIKKMEKNMKRPYKYGTPDANNSN